MELFLLLLSSMLAFLTGKVSGPLYNKSIGKYTRNAYYTIALVLLTIICVFWQQWLKDQKESEAADILNFERLKNENLIKNQTLIIKDGVRSGVDSIVTLMAEAFKNQGVNFDSVKNEVIKLRNDTTKSAFIHAPDIDLCADSSIKITSMTNSIMDIYIMLCNTGAKAENVTWNYRIGTLTVFNKYEISKVSQMAAYEKQIIQANNFREFGFRLSGISVNTIKEVVLHIYGSYIGSDNRKKYNFNSYKIYDVASNKTFIPIGPKLDSIKKMYSQTPY